MEPSRARITRRAPGSGALLRRSRTWLALCALLAASGPVVTASVPAAGATAPAVAGVTSATVQRALAVVSAARGAGPLRVLAVTSTPATTPSGGSSAGTGPARTVVDARDGLGEVVVGVAQPSAAIVIVTAWAGGTSSQQWTFDPSSAGSTVSGPVDLPTSVTRVAIHPAPSPSSPTPGGSPAPTAGGGSPATSTAPAATSGAGAGDYIALCLVAAVPPVLQGSGYGPLIAFSGAVGFCTASPVTITDTLILWQAKGGGFDEVGSSQAGGVNSDTDGSVVPCYSPWSTYYGFHDQMIVTLSYAGGIGYGYVNSTTASLNCDH